MVIYHLFLGFLIHLTVLIALALSNLTVLIPPSLSCFFVLNLESFVTCKAVMYFLKTQISFHLLHLDWLT